MEMEVRALLAQISVGLGTIAAACDRLPDLEVAATACNLADQLQVATEAILQGTSLRESRTVVRDAIADMERVLAARTTEG